MPPACCDLTFRVSSPRNKKQTTHCVVCFLWSGRRGSNSLPPPWQGGALPDELRPHGTYRIISEIFYLSIPNFSFLQKSTAVLIPYRRLSLLSLHMPDMHHSPKHSLPFEHQKVSSMHPPQKIVTDPHGSRLPFRR